MLHPTTPPPPQYSPSQATNCPFLKEFSLLGALRSWRRPAERKAWGGCCPVGWCAASQASTVKHLTLSPPVPKALHSQVTCGKVPIPEQLRDPTPPAAFGNGSPLSICGNKGETEVPGREPFLVASEAQGTVAMDGVSHLTFAQGSQWVAPSNTQLSPLTG